MKSIGIVGCGAIGKALIQAAEAGKLLGAHRRRHQPNGKKRARISRGI